MEALCRPAAPEDLPAVAALWRRVFGDEEAFIRRCMAGFVGQGQVYVAASGQRIIAILSAVPCTLQGCKGIYLYALATDESARGGGVMSALMACAEQREAEKGAVFSALVPANAPLFDYYRPRGYDVDVPLRQLDLEAGPPAAATELADTGPRAEDLARLRAQWLKVPALSFDAGRLALVAEDLREAGARLAVAAEGYMVWLPGEKKVLVAELAARDTDAAQGMLAALALGTGGMPMRVTLPRGGGLFPGQGRPMPYGLLKPLADGRDWTGCYMRLVMDEMKA